MARSGSENRKRSIKRTVRFTEEEAAELHRRAIRAGLSEPAYVRLMCLDEKPARQSRCATPNEELIAKIVTHLAQASDHIKDGAGEDARYELMLARHLCFAALEAEP